MQSPAATPAFQTLPTPTRSATIPTPPQSPPPTLNGNLKPTRHFSELTNSSTSSSASSTPTTHTTQTIEYYKHQLIAKSSQIQTLQSALIALGSKHTDTLSQLRTLEQKLDFERRENAQREGQADELLDRALKFINLHEKKYDLLLGQLEERTRSLRDAEERTRVSVQEHHLLAQSHESAKRKLADVEKVVVEKAAEVKVARDQVGLLEGLLSRSRESEGEARERTLETEEKVKGLEEEKRILETKLAETSEAMQDLKRELVQLHQSKSEVEDKLKLTEDLLSQERQSLHTERENQERCLRALKSELDETISSLSSAEEKASTERALAGDLQVSLCVAEAKVKDLEARLAEAQEEAGRAKEALAKNTEAEDATSQAIQSERDALLEQKAAIEQEVKTKTQALDEAQVLITEERKAKEDALAQLEISQAEITQLRSQISVSKEPSTDSYSFTSATAETIESVPSLKSSNTSEAPVPVPAPASAPAPTPAPAPEVAAEKAAVVDPKLSRVEDFPPKGSPAPSVDFDLTKLPPRGERDGNSSLEIPKSEMSGGSLRGSNTSKRARVTSMFHIPKLSNVTPRSRTTSASSAKGLSIPSATARALVMPGAATAKAVAVPNATEESTSSASSSPKPFKTPGIFKRFSTKDRDSKYKSFELIRDGKSSAAASPSGHS